MGRWLSPDKPFADQHKANPQSWNLYSYVRNNPLKMIDQTGTVAEIAVNGNNIRITIPVYFTGPNTDARAIQAYSTQMQSAWTGQFGQYNVTTTVRQETTLLGTDTNVVNIAPTANGRDNAVVGGNLMNFNPLPADGDPQYGYYLWSSGHETGHNMDLPDEYKDVNGVSVPNPGYEKQYHGRAL